MLRPQALQLDLFTFTEPPAPGESVAQPETPQHETPQPEALQPEARPEALQEKPRLPEAASHPELVEKSFRLKLGRLMPDRLGSITLTKNRSSIVSAREQNGKLAIRIHHSFASAPDETLEAVATFLRSKRQSASRRAALAAIRAYFQSQASTPTPAHRPRRITLRPVGHTCDLRKLRDAINNQYFSGELSVHITWSKAPRRRKRHKNCGFSVRLGTYSERDGVVRIHPCLDNPKVPRYVIESVVHHEMLHAALPPVVVNGRRRIHTPEFRRRERLFSGYHKAERWIDRNIGRLIGAR